MEDKILKVISNYTPHPFDEIKTTWERLGKKFDLLLAVIRLASAQAISLHAATESTLLCPNCNTKNGWIYHGCSESYSRCMNHKVP